MADLVHRGIGEIGEAALRIRIIAGVAIAVGAASVEVSESELLRVEFNVTVEDLTGLCAVGRCGQGDDAVRMGPILVAKDDQILIGRGIEEIEADKVSVNSRGQGSEGDVGGVVGRLATGNTYPGCK